MKQATFVIEVILSDKKEDLILVRDPRSGQVLTSCNNVEELASFLAETISSAKSETIVEPSNK